MQALFQGILFDVEKGGDPDFPYYSLSKNKKDFGTLFPETKRFIQCVIPGNEIKMGECLVWEFKPSDFIILNYDIVDKEWLKSKMEERNLSAKEVKEFCGVKSDSTVHRWLDGSREIEGAAKAILFNLFNKTL